MEPFQTRLNEIVEKINYIESNRMKISEFLRKINNTIHIGPSQEVLDINIINPVPAKHFGKTSVLGVDGGIVKSSYHGLDLMLMRTVGVNFVFNDDNLREVDYYPSSNPEPRPKIIFDVFSNFELNSCYNFERQMMEISTATEAAEKMNPDILLMDGSIIPHYITKPDNPLLKKHYKELIRKYKTLFELSNNMILAGVIEDSRGIEFCDVLNRNLFSVLKANIIRDLKLVLRKTKDSNLLYYVLKKGERTCAFNYSKNPEVHPLLKEFGDLSSSFFTFYIKTVDFDRPLRVDFLSTGNHLDTVNKLSSILMLMAGHSGYGIPSVLIEADQRAKLSGKDLEMFYSDLVNRIGNISTLFRMRRETRPF